MVETEHDAVVAFVEWLDGNGLAICRFVAATHTCVVVDVVDSGLHHDVRHKRVPICLAHALELRSDGECRVEPLEETEMNDERPTPNAQHPTLDDEYPTANDACPTSHDQSRVKVRSLVEVRAQLLAVIEDPKRRDTVEVYTEDLARTAVYAAPELMPGLWRELARRLLKCDQMGLFTEAERAAVRAIMRGHDG